MLRYEMTDTQSIKSISKTREAHNNLIEKCDHASRACTELANLCSREQAEARSKKIKTRVFGGSASAVLLGGGLVAAGAVVTAVTGIFTLGAGAVAGAGITATGFAMVGTLATGTTAYVAYRYASAVDTFRSMCSSFQDMATKGREIKRNFDEIDVILVQCKTTADVLLNAKRQHVTTICKNLSLLKKALKKLAEDRKDVLNTFKTERFHKLIAEEAYSFL